MLNATDPQWLHQLPRVWLLSYASVRLFNKRIAARRSGAHNAYLHKFMPRCGLKHTVCARVVKAMLRGPSRQ